MKIEEFNKHRDSLMEKLPLLRQDEKGLLNVPYGTLTDLWSLVYGITNGISETSEITEFNQKKYMEIV